nr:NADH dehydrogenase subunit 6 [Archotermopsis wroughtoni]
MIKTMMISSTTMSIMFTQMKHPMAMGMLLMMQTVMTCTISGMMNQMFWFSYILFLIFLGGMLVLFIYMTSLASNEMISVSTKMLVTTVVLTMMMMVKTKNQDKVDMHETDMNEKMTMMLEKFYNQPTGTMTLLMASYLLLTLIVIAKITSISSGPLRKSK